MERRHHKEPVIQGEINCKAGSIKTGQGELLIDGYRLRGAWSLVKVGRVIQIVVMEERRVA